MTTSRTIGYFLRLYLSPAQMMAKTRSAPESFESAITELENIVKNMEAGEISLEQALESYQRGIGLLRYCQNTLLDAEQRMRELEGGMTAEDNGSERENTPS